MLCCAVLSFDDWGKLICNENERNKSKPMYDTHKLFDFGLINCACSHLSLLLTLCNHIQHSKKIDNVRALCMAYWSDCKVLAFLLEMPKNYHLSLFHQSAKSVNFRWTEVALNALWIPFVCLRLSERASVHFIVAYFNHYLHFTDTHKHFPFELSQINLIAMEMWLGLSRLHGR